MDDKYKRIEKIGDGTYSTVYKGQNKQTNDFVAIKKAALVDDREGLPATCIRECAILRLLQDIPHPNIVKLLDIYIENDRNYIILEYCDQDLGQFIGPRRGGSILKFDMMPWPTIKSFLKQILSALAHCHEMDIIHRDLKPQNILIKNGNLVQVGDWGLARHLHYPRAIQLTQEVQTLWYRAPELFLGLKEYGAAVDLWSVGCVFAEMIMGKPIFDGDCEIGTLMKIFEQLGTPTETDWKGLETMEHFKCTFPKFQKKVWTSISERFADDMLAVDLISKLLTFDPSIRITASEALCHPYFSEIEIQVKDESQSQTKE